MYLSVMNESDDCVCLCRRAAVRSQLMMSPFAGGYPVYL